MMLGTGLRLAASTAPQRWWPENALFAADFINDRYMSGGVAVPASAAISFSRASPKRAQSIDGTWRLFADNVPAITDRGLLLEQASTNLLPNSAFAGGVATTYSSTGSIGLPSGYTIRNMPSGCSADITYGNESGLPFMDIRLYGTATNNTPFVMVFCPNNAVSCAVGQALQLSLGAKLISGTIPISTTFRLYEYDGGGANLSTTDLPALDTTGDVIRLSQEYVTSNPAVATVAPALRVGIGTGATVDFVIRVKAPQAEKQVTSATSPILTLGSVSTRAADAISCHLPTGTSRIQRVSSSGAVSEVSASPGTSAIAYTGQLHLIIAMAG